MEAKEIWKIWHENKMPKSHKLYILWEVSDQGNVKRNGKLYECKLNNKGYKIFNRWKVHRVVAELFIPNPENKPCIDHINTNKLDNRAINLRWVTPKENSNNPLTLKHLSEMRKGKNTGPKSKEHRKHISDSLKGKSTWNKGKILGPQSPETRKRKSESMKQYWQNKKLNKSL